jgi:Na+-translocating ferredoxin:NAD+ oxidoreductase RnfG subunit
MYVVSATLVLLFACLSSSLLLSVHLKTEGKIASADKSQQKLQA